MKNENNTLVVYVGCALTHASVEYKESIKLLKKHLSQMKGVEVLEFIDLVNGTPLDVYEHDIHRCVGQAHLVIAECSYPALGLGWELGAAVEKYQKYVLTVAKQDAKVTRLISGAECSRNPKYSFKIYNSFAELVDICTNKIKELQGLSIDNKE